jgi:DNA-binding transcriptional LysR family regulator
MIIMDFKPYNYVITIAEEKSFSKAALRLFVSQSALSQYITRLEKELGAVLFDRATKPVKLTYEGELYVETAKKIQHIHEELLNYYDESNNLERGRLNIGITPSKANHPLPLILTAYKAKYPQIDVHVTEASSSGLEEILEKGLADLCILNLPALSPEITSEELYDEKILLVAPAWFEAPAGRDFLSSDEIKKLSNEKFILQRQGQRLRQVADSVFVKAGFKPKVLLETGNIETAARLAVSGLGCAFIPQTFAPGGREETASVTGGKCAKCFAVNEPPLKWTVGVAYKKEKYLSKAAHAFMDVTKEVVENLNLTLP